MTLPRLITGSLTLCPSVSLSVCLSVCFLATAVRPSQCEVLGENEPVVSDARHPIRFLSCCRCVSPEPVLAKHHFSSFLTLLAEPPVLSRRAGDEPARADRRDKAEQGHPQLHGLRQRAHLRAPVREGRRGARRAAGQQDA